MQTVLVHGAAGFVARCLVPRLVDRHLVLVDRRPLPPEVQREVEAAGGTVDVVRAGSLTALPEELSAQVDVAVVLAGATNVDEAFVDPAAAFALNTAIAIDAGEWLRHHPGARLVYVSTDEVLGPSRRPLGESAPLRPTQPYAASKAAAEVILHSLRDTYGLDVVTVRSCNLIGPHQRAAKLVPTAVRMLTTDRPVPVFGRPDHVREWMSVDDLSAALLLAVDGRLTSGLYHCSSGVHRSILDVIELVAQALSVPPSWRRVPDRLVHDPCYAMDASLLRSSGWQARAEVDATIRSSARHMAAACARGEVVTAVAGASS